VPLVSRNFNIGVVGANMESAHYQKYLQHMRHNTDATVRLAETHEVRRRRTLAPPHPRQAAPSPLREVACALPSRPDTRRPRLAPPQVMHDATRLTLTLTLAPTLLLTLTRSCTTRMRRGWARWCAAPHSSR